MPANTIHDVGFNANEWFVVGLIVVGTAVIWRLPRRFTPQQALFNLLIGIVFGLMFDHTLALPPVDLYDVGDQSQYQWFDIFSYIMYAPFGYIFIYFYSRLRVHGFYSILYLAAWIPVGIFIEWLGVLVGVFHYKHGYTLVYSIPIYAFLLSVHLLLYRNIFGKESQMITQQHPHR